MSGRLDRIDLKILRLLQNSGRLTNAELAETAGVSAATCHRRTQRLFDEGFISQVRAMVAPRKVGKGALVMVGVVLDRSTPESFAAFERAIAQLTRAAEQAERGWAKDHAVMLYREALSLVPEEATEQRSALRRRLAIASTASFHLDDVRRPGSPPA